MCPKVMRKKNSHCRKRMPEAGFESLRRACGPLKLHCDVLVQMQSVRLGRDVTLITCLEGPAALKGSRNAGSGGMKRDQLSCWKRPPGSPFSFQLQVAVTHLGAILAPPLASKSLSLLVPQFGL